MIVHSAKEHGLAKPSLWPAHMIVYTATRTQERRANARTQLAELWNSQNATGSAAAQMEQEAIEAGLLMRVSAYRAPEAGRPRSAEEDLGEAAKSWLRRVAANYTSKQELRVQSTGNGMEPHDGLADHECRTWESEHTGSKATGLLDLEQGSSVPTARGHDQEGLGQRV